MAIKVNIAVTLAQLLTACGYEKLIVPFEQNGVKVEFYAKEMKLVKMPQFTVTAVINTTSLPMFVGGSLGVASHQIVKEKVSECVKVVAQKLGLEAELGELSAGAYTPKAKPKAKIVEVPEEDDEPEQATYTPPKPVTIPTHLAELMGKMPVPLANASVIYQPVNGSSTGSRYFAVAVSKDVKVGVRIRKGRVSFRVEGEKMKNPAFTAHLGSMGLSVSGVYASVHVDATKEMRNKVVGSLLFATGVPFEQVATALDPIIAQGE